MAATNFTPIQLYHSTTASAAPVAGNLANGELAINITDGKLFYKDNGGTVQVLATKGTGTIGGSNTQVQYNSSGALAGSSNFTFNGTTATINTLNLTNALGTTYGGTGLNSYTTGDIVYASASNTLSKLTIGTNGYILTSNGTIPTWTAGSSISVNTATNLAGGATGSVPYQSGAGATTFLSIGSANTVLTSSGTGPQWVTSLSSLTGVSSSAMTNTSLTSGRVVYSTTGGAQTDSASLTFNGTTLTAGGFATGGSSTLDKLVKIGDSAFNLPAVLSATAPAKLYVSTATVTDASSAGGATNTLGTITSFGSTTVAASNTGVTYTNLATLYIAGAPTAGTNVTITNPYALYVAAGDAYFGGTVTAGTVNLTTLDLTNLEVTNIKAKDGTASITLADSTGVASFTANPVLSGGTANGVAYLNGSKVLTTGSALTFDGSSMVLNTSTSSDALRITQTGSGNALAVEDSANPDSTPFVIDANGREILGYTSTLTVNNYAGNPVVPARQQIAISGAATSTLQAMFAATNYAVGTIAAKSRGTTVGDYAVVNNGDRLYSLNIQGADGTAFIPAADISAYVDGTPGTNDMPGRLVFSTSADGSATPTERLRIDSSGTVTNYGNTVLGDASTDTVTVNGYMGVGGAPNSSIAIYANPTALVGLAQTGVYSFPVGTSGATTAVRAFLSLPSTATATYTSADVAGYWAGNAIKGAGSTITNQHGVYIADQTQGTNNYGITSLVSSGSNKWNIYASGTAQNYFAGNVGIGTSSPGTRLDVNGSTYNPLVIRRDGGTDANTGVVFQLATNYWNVGAGTDGNFGIAYNSTNLGTSTQFRITSSGNVGIGTSSPAYSLDVLKTTDAISGAQISNLSTGSSARAQLLLTSDSVSAQTVATSSANTAAALGGRASTFALFTGSGDSAGGIAMLARNASGYITFHTGGNTERARITSAGNLLVGVTPTSPFNNADGLGKLVVQNNGNSNIALVNSTNDAYTYITNDGSYLTIQQSFNVSAGVKPMRWMMTSTQSMTLDTNSNLLIGQTSKTTGATISAKLGVTAGITVTNGSYGGYIEGINTSGTLSGYLSFGSSYNAFNAGEVGLGTSGSVDLLFATNNAVRGRFTSGGYFKASSNGTYVNSTASYHEFRQTATGNVSVYNTNTTADPYGIRMSYTGASPNGTDNWFLYCEDSGPTLRMSVRSNGGIANYSANDVNLSDRREKTNFAPAGEYLSKICAIPVQTFNYIDQSEDDPGLTLGVVAQDVQAVAPELVMESNWGTKDEPKMRLSIYQTDLQYALMKALQELKAEFDAYKATHP